MPTTEVTITSQAAEKGYGWFSFGVLTDPYADVGTAATLTMNAGANVVSGQIGVFGAWFYDSVRRISAGPKTASCTVAGYDPGTGSWNVEALAFSRFALADRTLTAEAKWCVSGGGPSGTDAEIDWGDGSAKQTGTMTAPTWTTGLLTFTHTYPLLPTARTYTVKVTSGAQNVSRAVTVPGTGRAVVRPATGTTGAVVDIQQWPDRTFERSNSVLPIVGRRDPVVLVDELRLPGSTITFLTLTAAEGAALLAMLRTTGPLQLLSPCAGVEDTWFVPLDAKPARLTNNGSDVRRLWDVTIQEVAAP